LFKLKLRLDIVAALLLKELRVESSPTCTYLLPNIVGLLVLSAPGCSAQVPHTDYKVRYTEHGREVVDPSYLVLQTGRENASLLVWPGSHHIAVEFERYADACKSKEPNPGLLAQNQNTLQTYEKRLCSVLRPQQVKIPPSSAFIGRGDLVDAGDACNGPEPRVRNHVHCTATGDMLANIIFIRPFGN
jgi:ectoine hydroxylase-related dioxygenase (phytanoyl-CoA dioxygenase family)